MLGAGLRARIPCPAGQELNIPCTLPGQSYPALFLPGERSEAGTGLLTVHGIGGDLRCPQAVSLASWWRARAFGPCLLFSLCPQTGAPRLYHGGSSANLGCAYAWLRRHCARVVLVGFSLGANVLVKWLGEEELQDPGLLGAISVCNPWDLDACGRHLESRWSGRLYRRSILRPLKRRALELERRYPGSLAAAEVGRALTLRDYDSLVTAPLHGFADVDDYYRRSSSNQYLPRVRSRLLCIDALDDPFIAPGSLPQTGAETVENLRVRHGGHLGFLGPGLSFWLEETICARVEGWLQSEAHR